jgi:hypothetical protein
LKKLEIERIAEDDPIWNTEIELDENEIQILTRSMEDETMAENTSTRLTIE